ncbi:endonuclease/exonuclease/phosphatase family protein [Sphingobium boeckii]|uniref:Endonuclease/exonuclease/phosphatase family metal-dependent hydrolase n=1 Tax=Sphingobium boeckii TaxID=1082345 RepID=A0A7W9AK39_9SPHN|nr:endonuclease/exonuclease/phosphatase family protein [Sphingobium boeckii]MBB5686956.1 endonuclease/exonuclease/phosphatase family metal-dependent hydrolase [Sphingobium boeckii]
MIRVASYNIHKAVGTDNRRNPDRILAVLNEIQADVITLQEADRRFGARMGVIPLHLLEEHSDYVHVPFDIRADSLGWHGNAILVRKSAEILHREVIHIPALEPRGAVMADVKVNGVKIRVVGMHLDLSGLWRRRQARAILANLDACEVKYPTVMMGDLNEWSRQSGCLHDFARHYRFAACGKSFHARRPVATLDRIMIGEGLEIADAGTHHSPIARRASDHLPVWADLEAD